MLRPSFGHASFLISRLQFPGPGGIDLKRTTADEFGWGSAGKNGRVLDRFRTLLRRIEEPGAVATQNDRELDHKAAANYYVFMTAMSYGSGELAAPQVYINEAEGVSGAPGRTRTCGILLRSRSNSLIKTCRSTR